MRSILLFISLISSPILFAQIEQVQPTTSKENKKKNQDDVLKCRDPRFRMVPDCNGTVYFDQDQEAVMHKKSGKPFTGSCKVCHINGNLEMYLTYQNGREIGQDTVYFPDGTVQLVRSHSTDGTGKEDGTWMLYREDGSIKWEKNYVQGAPHGEFRYYYPDSSLWKIETWEMGQLNGKKQEFYPNNSLKKEIMYKNGEWDGKYITYFENGMVESEQMFENGKKEGLSKYYYEDGALFYEENHKNGCREGEFRRFFPKDNRKWTVENYKNNLRHGLFEEYYDTEKNTIKYRATYEDGVLIKEQFFDEFGDETSPPKEKKKPFTTAQEAKQAEQWPADPSDEWLEKQEIDRKKYMRKRKKYLKNKKKQMKKRSKNNDC